MRLIIRLLLSAALCIACCANAASPAGSVRAIIAAAALSKDEAAQVKLVNSLVGSPDPAVKLLLNQWKGFNLFLYQPSPDAAPVPVILVGAQDDDGKQQVQRVDDGRLMLDKAGHPLLLDGDSLSSVNFGPNLRDAMASVLELADLYLPDPVGRINAVQGIEYTQNLKRVPALEERLAIEKDSAVRRALVEAIAVVQLKDPSAAVRIDALHSLDKLHSLGSYGFIQNALAEARAGRQPAVASAALDAIHAIDLHKDAINFWGTLFRGLSNGSILLVVTIGLAITFGLMGVINMAHGEMIAIGAYTTYLVENLFGSGIAIPCFGLSLACPGLHATGWHYQIYFLVAIPLSFLTAALVGIALERCVIRFLYRRPLESLLATWGVSLLLQQCMKLMFGSNNVQVNSPAYLSSNWTIDDVTLGWNRIFVIVFAVLIVVGVWAVLTRTPLGLLIRSVMQNRNMASCMGVRTERVNMLTFGLGSGLAGLAGSFISQIGNVGPTLGQNYIVDSFMTVVVGGVGNLAGTIYSALGIGFTDQSLQQILGNPVIGKILVLVAIILFLQWRPSGLFVTRTRSLDD